MSEEELSSLIGCIYDAAIEPASWPHLLEQLSLFVGGCAATIYSKDATRRTIDIAFDYGVERRFRENYISDFVKIDPTTIGSFYFDVGEVVSVTDILPYGEFSETRFFKEWVQPQNFSDAALSILDKSVTSYAAFSVFQHQKIGQVDGEMRRRMNLVVPHIRRAVLIGRIINLHKNEATAFADTLDTLVAALFLLDARGHVVQANASGRSLIAEASVLRASGGRLVINDASADTLLREALIATQGGDDNLGTRGISLPIPGPDSNHYVAHVLPLTAGARRKAGAGYAATAAVFMHKTDIELPSAPEAIAKLYKLTPSELRVLLKIFEIGGVPDVAVALGISEATAKTHLRRLFEKTGTSRQADLVKLVAGFADMGRSQMLVSKR